MRHQPGVGGPTTAAHRRSTPAPGALLVRCPRSRAPGIRFLGSPSRRAPVNRASHHGTTLRTDEERVSRETSSSLPARRALSQDGRSTAGVARRALEVGHCLGAVRTGPARGIRAARTVGLPPAPVIHGHYAEVREPHLMINRAEEPRVKAPGCAASCSGGADGMVSRETRAAGRLSARCCRSRAPRRRGTEVGSAYRRGAAARASWKALRSVREGPPSANATRPLWLDGVESGTPVSTSHRGEGWGTTIPCCGPLTTAAGVLPRGRGSTPDVRATDSHRPSQRLE